MHEARKDLKKARAAVRLIRDRLDADRYRVENARLREAGRVLSGARDADVRIETLEKLRDRYRDQRPDALGPLAGELAAAGLGSNGGASDTGLREARRTAAELIERSRDSTAELKLDREGWKLLRGGLERAYREGRRGFRRVVAEPEPEAVHEWRKRVKDLWYHLRLMHDSDPSVVGAFAGQADRLADLLGDHHDLTVLIEDLGRRPAGREEAAPVIELAELRQAELLGEAIPLGERLYAEKPRAFERRMHAYWRAWR